MKMLWPCLLAALLPPVASPDWSSLRDQQGRPLAAPTAPSVVVLVGARRARDLRAWEERLRTLDPRPEVTRVVDVPAGGKPDEVARKLRQRAPAGVAIAVDARRTVAGTLDLDTREPNVLVIDASGRVAARVRGRADERSAAAVRAAWKAAVGSR